jgi:hypothetical protein
MERDKMSSPDHRTLDTEAMARRVYYATIESLAKTQHDLAMLDLIEKTWGDDALVSKRLLRGNIHSLRDRVEIRARHRERLIQRHAELKRDAEILEQLLTEKDDDDMLAMAKFFAQRFREARKK